MKPRLKSSQGFSGPYRMNILLFSLAVFPQGWGSSGGGRDENKIEANTIMAGVVCMYLVGRGGDTREKKKGERERTKKSPSCIRP